MHLRRNDERLHELILRPMVCCRVGMMLRLRIACRYQPCSGNASCERLHADQSQREARRKLPWPPPVRWRKVQPLMCILRLVVHLRCFTPRRSRGDARAHLQAQIQAVRFPIRRFTTSGEVSKAYSENTRRTRKVRYGCLSALRVERTHQLPGGMG